MNPQPETMRVAAEIDLSAIRHNVREMAALPVLRGVPLCAVLKADGYGHGAVPLAMMLEKEDAVSSFAVATADEACALRTEAGVKKPVMILGYAFPESDEALFACDIEPSVFYEETVLSLERTAKRIGTKKKLKVHIPVDTGMGRIGITPDDRGLAFVRRVAESPALSIEGVFTHFAAADEEDGAFCEEQTSRFRDFVEEIRTKLSLQIPVVHADNSAAILSGRGDPFDMVRAGIAMYGYAPSPAIAEMCQSQITLKPALSFVSHVSFVKEVPAGTTISYGATFVCERPSKIATIPIGYADGYPRMLSGKAHVLIRGKRVPIAGRVCMDQMMADVTDLEGVAEGDRVTLIGTDGDLSVTAEELGTLSGRFHYELLCCINKRVPRLYRD